ncbi:MAG TPA: universal stress protein [Gemmatimonadaceae bacterium]
MSFKRVALGIDFSEPSLSAARWTARHLVPDAELTLVHVVPNTAPPGFLGSERGTAGRVLHGAREATAQGLRGLANSLDAMRCITTVRVGDVTEQLVEAAVEVEADLIVVGRTGRRGGRGLGTTADRLSRRAPLPVLLAARTLHAAPRNILAALDESEIGLDVLRWTRRLGLQCDASITALHVVRDELGDYFDAAGAAVKAACAGAKDEIRAGTMDGASSAQDDDQRGAPGVSASAHAWLRTRLRAAGIDATREASAVTIGDPRHEVLVAADCFDAEIIVVGRHGVDADDGSGIGSVARAVLRPSTRSVLVVPPVRRGPAPPDPRRPRPPLAIVRSTPVAPRLRAR